MKIFFTALLSFLTLIGGHFVNRRWDRAVLFLSLSIVYSIICFIIFGISIGDNTDGLLLAYSRMYDIIVVGLILIILISTAVTVLDRKKSHSLSQIPFTMSGKVGSSLLSIISFGFILFVITGYISFKNVINKYDVSDTGALSSYSTTSSKWFNESIKFGTGSYLAKPKEMREGEGYLTGQIMSQRNPAVGVRLKLQFNDEFETENVVTDENGRFVLRLPVGEWYVTKVEVNQWENKPDGEYLLVSGYESKLSNGYFSQYPVGEAGGLFMNITKNKPEASHISLKIQPNIHFQNKHQNRRTATLSIKSDKIEWPAFTGATQYQVSVSRTEKDGSSRSFYPTVSKIIKGKNELDLKSLKTKEIDTDDKKETYNIKITAFSEDGSFISESRGYQGYSFQLKEQVKISEDKGSRFSVESMNLRRKYSKKFDAIELLIDEKLYSAANTLLQKDMKGATPGKKEALWGYYYASQKQCKKAKEFFNKANEIGGAGCVINKHEKLCM